MQVHAWLVLVLVACFSPLVGIVAADAAPPGSEPEIDGTRPSPSVTPAPRDWLGVSEVVTARVYKSPDLADEILQAALDVAQSVFVAASVQIVWKICGPSECNTPPSPAETLLRFVNSRGRNLDTRCLGDALIDAQKGKGVMATVYLDRVVQLARNLEIDHRVLLGRTIAHEIGHLLLGSSTHGTTGLMREIWSKEELLGRRADDWMLHPFEAAAIRQRLTLARSAS